MKHNLWGGHRSLRVLLAFFALSILSSPALFAQGSEARAHAEGLASARCSGDQISLRHVTDDAAMGGVRGIQYAFTNTSSSPCTLKGYPRFELLNRSGRAVRRARNGLELMGDEYKKAPEEVTLEPGKSVTFWVDYHARGAGAMGGPCPTYRKVRISAPGIKRVFVLRADIELCSGLHVSPILSEAPVEQP